MSRILSISLCACLLLAAGPALAADTETTEERAAGEQPPLAEPRRPLSELASDAVITAKVKTALLAEASVGPLQVSVETREGVVTLEGEADSAEQAQAAVRTARGIEGAREVVNHLKARR